MLIRKDLNLELSFDDYIVASNRFLGLCNECGIDSDKIGFFGNIGFPGISDIDAFVYDKPEKLRCLEKKHLQEIKICSVYGYVFWHIPVLVPEVLLDFAPFLHTLESLKFVDNQSHITKPAAQQREVINIVWFIFLIELFLHIRQSYLYKKPLSLRLLILVYKNLTYSNNVFSNSNNYFRPYLSSGELRELIKENYHTFNKKNEEEIFSNFFNLFEHTLSSFDKYCEKSSVFLSKDTLNGNRYLLKSFRQIYKKQDRSSLSTKKKFSVIGLNPQAFSLTVDLINGFSTSPIINNYISALKNCINYCHANNMTVPFINIASTPKSYFKRLVYWAANKIISTIR